MVCLKNLKLVMHCAAVDMSRLKGIPVKVGKEGLANRSSFSKYVYVIPLWDVLPNLWCGMLISFGV